MFLILNTDNLEHVLVYIVTIIKLCAFDKIYLLHEFEFLKHLNLYLQEYILAYEN